MVLFPQFSDIKNIPYVFVDLLITQVTIYRGGQHDLYVQIRLPFQQQSFSFKNVLFYNSSSTGSPSWEETQMHNAPNALLVQLLSTRGKTNNSQPGVHKESHQIPLFQYAGSFESYQNTENELPH